MKKKIIIAAILALVVAIPVFTAAAVDNNQNDWFNRMLSCHEQMIQTNVNDGTITTAEGDQLKEHFRQDAPIIRKIMEKNGMGPGMRMGMGPGMGRGQGMMGSQGPCYYYGTSQ
ncbi:MAG: hypothetical protein ACOYD5_01375 [Negativicutes bacterium]|jgi:hypothetical protein